VAEATTERVLFSHFLVTKILPTHEQRFTARIVAPLSDVRLIRSGIPWKCAFSRLATSITSPLPAPMRSNSQ